jgi:hypothetical protein
MCLPWWAGRARHTFCAVGLPVCLGGFALTSKCPPGTVADDTHLPTRVQSWSLHLMRGHRHRRRRKVCHAIS